MSDHEAEPTRRRLTDILGRDGLKQFLGLLSEGKPVEVSAIAQASGLEPDLLRSELRAQPGTDWDENGRLVGFGLTLRETPHRFVVSGRTLFTWCAIDTLIFPVLMGVQASVASSCAATGTPISFRVSPTAVEDLRPVTAVVSEACPTGEIRDLRSQVCDQGHFYESADAASKWRSQHPSGRVLLVEDALVACRAFYIS
jgi:alkylmercury lyase